MGVFQTKCDDCGVKIVALLSSYDTDERPVPLHYDRNSVVGFIIPDEEDDSYPKSTHCKKCWQEKHDSGRNLVIQGG